MQAVAILGASGNVGRPLVEHLLKVPTLERLLVIGRRKIEDFPEATMNDKRVEQYIVNLDQIDKECVPILQNVQAVFITMGVGAPSKVTAEELERVDYLIPKQFAVAAKEANVQHVSILTSTGSNYLGENTNVAKRTYAGSAYYLHVKGKVEKEISDLNFPFFATFRPSVLVGNANTPGFFNWLAPKLDWALPRKYNSIHINDLSKAMCNVAVSYFDKDPKEPYMIFEGEPLFKAINRE